MTTVETTVVNNQDQNASPADARVEAAMKMLDTPGEGEAPQGGEQAKEGTPPTTEGTPPGEKPQTEQPAPEAKPGEGQQPKPDETQQQAKPKEEPAKDPNLERGYHDLMRREGATTRKEAELDRREAALKERETGLADIKELVKEDPVAAAAAIGLDYADLTSAILGKEPGKGDKQHTQLSREQQRQADEIAKLKQDREEEKKAAAASRRVTEAQQFLDKTEGLVLSRKYGQDAVEFALQLQDASEEVNGYRPTLEQAYQWAEGYYRSKASELFEDPTVRSALNLPEASQTPTETPGTQAPTGQSEAKPAQDTKPAAETAQPKQDTQTTQQTETLQGQQPQAARTLSNDMEANAAPRNPGGPKSADDYRRDAMRKLDEMTKNA